MDDLTPEAATSPVAPPPGNHSTWMRLAWLASGAPAASGRDASGAVAVRCEGPQPPRLLLLASGQDTRTALAELVVQAARNGVSLREAHCYHWPLVSSKLDFRQLLDCGIKAVYTPELAVPKRLTEVSSVIRWEASCMGVQMRSLSIATVFGPLRAALCDDREELHG